MLEEQRKRNEMFQGIGDTAVDMYEGAKTLGSEYLGGVKERAGQVYDLGADAIQGAQDLYTDFTKPDVVVEPTPTSADDLNLFDILGETDELVNKKSDAFVPNPKGTKFWNENAEITHNIKQNISKVMGVGEDIVDMVMPILGNTTPAILLNPNHPKHQEAKDLFLNATRGLAQGVMQDLPQGTIDLGVDAINYGANKLGYDDVIDTDKSSTLWNVGFTDEEEEALGVKESVAYNLFRVGGQLVTGYGGIKALTANVMNSSRATKIFKEALGLSLPGGTLNVQEGNLSTFVNSTDYKNAVTEFMDSKVGGDVNAEERFVARLKNMGEELGLGFAIPGLYAFAKTVKSTVTDPQSIKQFMEKFPGVQAPIEMNAVPVNGRFPSEMGQPNMTQSEMAVAKDNSLPFKEPNDNSHLQGLLDDAVEKENRIALNENKAEVKANAKAQQQAELDAKPQAEVDELGFYSKAEQALLDLKQEKNLPEDIITYLKKKGVTQGELEDTGLLEMLTKKKASGDRVTKQGLLDYIGDNKVRLHEYQKYGASEGDALDNMGDFELDDPDFYNGADGGNMSVVDDSDYIYSRAEDMKYELNSGDEFEMNRLFEYLHKSDPEKYPKTIDMQIEEIELSLKRLTDADREVLKKPVSDITLEERRKLLGFYKDNIGNPHEQAIMLPTEDVGIYGADGLRSKNMDDIVTEINKFFGDSDTKLIDLQNKRTTTNGHTDDWAGQIGKKIDDGDLDNLDFDIDDATYAMSEADYLENPFYEWNTRSGYSATGNEDIGITIRDPDGDFLNNGEPVYSRIEANIQINEHAMGNGLQSFEGDTLYSSYTQPGMTDKSTYREIPIMGRLKGQERFTGAHMNEDDIVAWLRTSDRVDSDGKRVLFIEEVQSDWHQQGRKRGYNKTTKAQAKGINRRIKEIESRDIPNAETMINVDSVKWNARLEKLKDEMAQLRGKLADIDYNVPNAPLKNEKWQEAAVARAMKIASEEGYDRVVFANAKQQLDNWNPSRRRNE
ncbi:MAG: hypothetical protein ABGY11_02300, partial [Candidatus Thioglobus sp.]